jgi:hypothetical protein
MRPEEDVNPYAAPVSPPVDVEPATPVSVKRELREWLGLTLADLLVYLAAAAIAAMFFTRDVVIDAARAAVGLISSLAGCLLGMKRDPKLSRFTNLVKEFGYPVFVGLAVLVVAVHYLYWSGR